MGGFGCLTIGGGVIADLFDVDRRGLATSLYSLGPLFGPVIGPVCGGFIAQRASWRWVFWVLLIVAGTVTVGIELLSAVFRRSSTDLICEVVTIQQTLLRLRRPSS